MSATMSASGGSPYLKPKLISVSGVPGGALVARTAPTTSRRELVDVECRRVDDDVGALAHGREALRARAGCRRGSCRRPAADAAGAPPRTAGRARRPRRRGTPRRTCRRRRAGSIDLGQLGEQVAAAHVDDGRDPAAGRSPACSARSSSGRSICGGRLSTTYQSRSSRALAAVERPAPDIPVTISTSPASLDARRVRHDHPRRRVQPSDSTRCAVNRGRELRADARQLGDLVRRRAP